MIIYIFLFAVSLILTYVLTPLVIPLAERIGAVDVPAERKVHQISVPRLGGLAVVAALYGSLLIGCLVNRFIRGPFLDELGGIMAGSLIIVTLGIIDDIRNLSPWLKLVVQTAAAGVAVALGVHFELASNPIGAQMRDTVNLGVLGIPLSMLWIIVLTNAMNIIDGLDGLACGIALFTSATLLFISINQGAGFVTYVYAALAGSTLAFLKYNRYPARIFLGDTGSMFLGFTLACLTIRGTQKSFAVSAFLIPLIVFGIPLFDSILAVLRRYFNSRNVGQADREHIHHRLLDVGLTQRQVVHFLYGVTILLGIIAFSFTVMLDEYAALIVFIIGLMGAFLARELNLVATPQRRFERKKRWEEEEERREQFERKKRQEEEEEERRGQSDGKP